jgi:alginate O-acetyltransferase complex protein AlgJ
LPGGKREAELSPGPMPDHVQISGEPGPTIMVIGDSFTTDLFTIMLVQHVGRAIWINHQRCGFDWKWIDAYHPDEVWWMPTERFLNCKPGLWPTGLGR